MSDLSDEILYGNYDGIVKLLNNGIDVNKRDQYGLNPIIQAAIRENLAVTKLLLEHGAEVNRRDIAGGTALFWAADNNNYELCELLLKNGSDPNLYTTDGQPILVHPRLRGQKELISLLVEYGADITFAKDYINAKLIGHRFELTGKADIINAKGNFIELDFEGFTPEFTLGIIRSTLITFVNSYIGKTFSQYTNSLNKIIDVLADSIKLIPPRYKRKKAAHEIALEPVLKNQLLIIPVTYRGHAITFVKYLDLLARCDRGVNNFTDTIVIYKVNNPYLMNNQFIKKLIYEHLTDQFIHSEIKTLLSLESIVTMPTKSQISGNCSWANVEAGVVAALFMLQYKRIPNTKTEAAKLKNQVMKFYDAWVEWDKDRGLDDCIENFQQSQTIAQKASKAAIMGSILFQRCSYGIKRELERAKKILCILTLKEYKYILKSYIDVYRTAQSGAIGEKFTKLLEKCNLNINTISLDEKVLNAVLEKYQRSNDMLVRLHKAAASGQLDLVRQLFYEYEAMEVDTVDNTGSTALIYAAWEGHLDIVKYLVEEQGANIKIINDKGGNAIKYAGLANHQDIVDYLSHR